MNLLQWRDHAQSTISMTTSDSHGDPRTITTFLAATRGLELYEEGNLVTIRKLGSGTSFEVHACRDERTGEVLAVKKLQMPKRESKMEEKVSNAVLRELKVSTYPPFLKHQNITQDMGIENIR